MIFLLGLGGLARSSTESPRAPGSQDNRPMFDFTRQMKQICTDVQRRSPQMKHLQLDRVAFSFVQAKNAELHGLQATLTPLRFEHGAKQGYANGQRCRVQSVHDRNGREMLYILNFYMPRFMNQKFSEKMTTLFHELLHISPKFNGDLRRFPGRCYMHSTNEKDFDRRASRLANDWLSRKPNRDLYEFLKLDFDKLRLQYGRVVGEHFTHPKLVAVKASA